MLSIFFRQIEARGSYLIPHDGPILFVAAPHANQFVDPLIVMRTIHQETGRYIRFLIAAKSMSRPFIGALARIFRSISVARTQDLMKRGTGKIYIAEENEGLLIAGINTLFKKELHPSDLIAVGNDTAEVVKVLSDNLIEIESPFSEETTRKLLRSPDIGTAYKHAPKVDQSKMFQEVFNNLLDGHCIGIFPEGGSHDRPGILPLKAGVAMMALGALEVDPACNIKVVPVGLNYFHREKFRSRAVIEFGAPLSISPDLVELYKHDKKTAVRRLLASITSALHTVTINAPDYETLTLISASRRLYRPHGTRLTLSQAVLLNRRFSVAYDKFSDHSSVIDIRKRISSYYQNLRRLNVRDHQVPNLKPAPLKVLRVIIFRSTILLILALACLPGVVLASPIFVLSKIVSHRKAQEALRTSTVKVKGTDVIATWKLLVTLAVAPFLFTLYTIAGTLLVYRSGYITGWKFWLVPFIIGWFIIPFLSWASLMLGESGMDILKSLRPLWLSLLPWESNSLFLLKRERKDLVRRIHALVDELGPQMFPDFDDARIIKLDQIDSADKSAIDSEYGYMDESASSIASDIMQSSDSTTLHRTASYFNFANVGVFTSPISTPNTSRRSSGTFRINLQMTEMNENEHKKSK